MSNELRKPEEHPEQVEVEPGQGAPGDEHLVLVQLPLVRDVLQAYVIRYS